MIKLFEMFSGYGGASFGLKKANIDFECIGISEIDKYAIQLYNQNFSDIKNFGDCTKINPNELPDFDLLTGGFPCQDVSVIGNRDLSKGRTILFDEIIRIAEIKKPTYMLLENVKGLLSSPFYEHCKKELKRIGYHSIIGFLNSKDYGIPQNRPRVWFVCKLGEWKFNEFQFPQKEELKIVLKDIIEKNPDKIYILSDNMKKYPHKIEPKISPCLLASGVIYRLTSVATIKTNKEPSFKGNRIIPSDKKYFSTLITNKNQNDKLSEKTRDLDKAIKVAQDLSIENNTPIQLDTYHLQKGEIRPLSTYIPQDFNVHRCLLVGKPKEVLIENGQIRYLTPRECFRLMGFLNDEIKLEGLTDTQKYKLAGNGWDINLVSKIFKRMFK